MGSALCSEEEFIDLIQRLGLRGTARHLKSHVKNVCVRRRSIEKRRGISIYPGSGIVNEPEPVPAIEMPAARPHIRIRPGKVKVMVIGDSHDSPEIPDKGRFEWMGAWANEERPDYIIQIGDALTLDSLNSHIPDSTLDGKLKPAFMADIASGRMAWDAFESRLNYQPSKRITFGNHERRVWLAEQMAPHVAGLMVGELIELFESRGWEWSPYGEIFFLNGVGFVHAALNRLGKTYGGKNAEMTICNDAVFDLVIGHSHTARKWVAPKIGPSKHVTVLNSGCALPQGHVESYAKHNTTGWSWGCNMITIEGHHITDDRFVSMSWLEDRFA